MKKAGKKRERVLFEYPEGASETRKEFIDLINRIITETGEDLTKVWRKINDDGTKMNMLPYSYDMIWGFVGEMTISFAPVMSFRYNTCSQVFPPLVER